MSRLNINITKWQRDVIVALVRNGTLGDSVDEVVRDLLDRAIRDLVMTEYLHRMRAFRESLPFGRPHSAMERKP